MDNIMTAEQARIASEFSGLSQYAKEEVEEIMQRIKRVSHESHGWNTVVYYTVQTKGCSEIINFLQFLGYEVSFPEGIQPWVTTVLTITW